MSVVDAEIGYLGSNGVNTGGLAWRVSGLLFSAWAVLTIPLTQRETGLGFLRLKPPTNGMRGCSLIDLESNFSFRQILRSALFFLV